MTDINDARMHELFDHKAQPLPDADFSAGVMRRLAAQERAGHVLAVVQGGAMLSLAALLALFLKERLLMWTQAANVPESLAQHPWWLAGLLIALCLLPSRLFKQAKPPHDSSQAAPH